MCDHRECREAEDAKLAAINGTREELILEMERARSFHMANDRPKSFSIGDKTILLESARIINKVEDHEVRKVLTDLLGRFIMTASEVLNMTDPLGAIEAALRGTMHPSQANSDEPFPDNVFPFQPKKPETFH